MGELDEAPDYSGWLIPRDAVALFPQTLKHAAIQQMLVRLEGGLIRAVATNAKWKSQRREREHREWWDVPSELWSDISNTEHDYDHFWKLDGDVQLIELSARLSSGYGYREDRQYSLFGVRFDRAGVEPLLPTLKMPAAEAAASAQPQVSAERSPVSAATLKTWWALCLTLKPSADWTVPEMLDYFDLCLPTKKASRDQIRKLRTEPKSGPKPRAAE